MRKLTYWGRQVLSSSNDLKTKPTPVKDLVAGILGPYGTSVLDVGARWGVADSWWRLDPVASLVGFEPDAQECERLNQLSPSLRTERYLPFALGAEKRQATLYQTKEPACASVYPPIADIGDRYPQLQVTQQVGTVKVDMIPLDHWWESEERPHVSFIKLDTQGSEFDILKGARQLLGECVGLEVEAEFSPIYQGQPLFTDIDTFLRAEGFVLWGLRDLCHYSESPDEKSAGRLYWGNAVYFRDYRALSNADTQWRQKLILAALLESYGDTVSARSCLKSALHDLGEQAPAPSASSALILGETTA